MAHEPGDGGRVHIGSPETTVLGTGDHAVNRSAYLSLRSNSDMSSFKSPNMSTMFSIQLKTTMGCFRVARAEANVQSVESPLSVWTWTEIEHPGGQTRYKTSVPNLPTFPPDIRVVCLEHLLAPTSVPTSIRTPTPIPITMLSAAPAVYIHSAAFDPAVHAAPSVHGKILARRLGLKRKATKTAKASSPVPAPVPRTMAGLKLDCTLVSLEAAQGRRRELPCGAFDIGCALVSLDVAQGRKEISHRVLRF